MERSEPKPNYFKLVVTIIIGVFFGLMAFCGALVWLYLGFAYYSDRASEQRMEQRRIEEQRRQQAFSDQLRNMINEGAESYGK